MILITGATGTNGLELIRQLGEVGEYVRVRALVRSPQRAQQLMHPYDVELSAGDLDDPASLNEAMRYVEQLFLLSPVDQRQVQLEANAIDAARRAGVKHIVKLSALNAAPDSPSALLRWHAQTERTLRESGIAYTILRPNMFMQEMLRHAGSIRGEGAFYLPLGDTAVSLVDVRDNAAVAARVLTEAGHEGKEYDLTGPAALTFHDAAAQLATAIGEPVQYQPVPMDAWKRAFAATGAPHWMVDVVAELYGTFAGNNQAVRDGVRQVTGAPARPFAEFARDYADKFQE